ncbi:hypothetical protein CDAR_60061 [Caerostris darwini]|uniref:Uncharacterized protein n=1 Tax=Caerostris darwini TaxID=1538125 RepID=A0AAV4QNR9_9ARAC|nr:hypothetical protein CDAR_60061 [Caerostris darwini]
MKRSFRQLLWRRPSFGVAVQSQLYFIHHTVMKADSKERGEREEFLKERKGVLRVKKVRERMRDKRGGDDSNAVSGGSWEVPSAISAFHGGWNWGLINDGCRPFTNDLRFHLDAGLNGMLSFP